MIDLHGIFAAQVKAIEIQGGTTLPKPVTIVAWERFYAKCRHAEAKHSQHRYERDIQTDGPILARWTLTQALAAYCKEVNNV